MSPTGTKNCISDFQPIDCDPFGDQMILSQRSPETIENTDIYTVILSNSKMTALKWQPK